MLEMDLVEKALHLELKTIEKSEAAMNTTAPTNEKDKETTTDNTQSKRPKLAE